MKKFVNDNITIIVVVALALAGFAAYSIYKMKKEKADTEPPLTSTGE